MIYINKIYGSYVFWQEIYQLERTHLNLFAWLHADCTDKKKSSILRLHTWQTRPQSEVSQKTSWPRPGPKHGCLVAMSVVFFLFMACRWGIIRGIISPSNTNKFPQYVGIIMYYDTWIANDLLGFSGGWCQCGCLFGVDEITSLLSLIQFLHRLPGQCLCAPRKKTL